MATSARRESVTRKTDDAVTTVAVRTEVASARSSDVTDDDIACRAYDLYLARGCEHGHEVADWLQAELELRGETAVV